jgi:hypothetical protein
VALVAFGMLAGGALAGKGQGAQNGNKNGTWHKNQTYTCQDGYSLTYVWSWAYQYDGGLGADLNGDAYVCYKYSGNNGGYTFVDDIAN